MSKKQIAIISVTVALVVLIAIYFGLKIYASNVAERKVNEAIAKVTNFVDIDYKKVSVGLFRRDVRISKVMVSPAGAKEKIKINEIIIHDIDDKSTIPTFLSVSLNGIELNLKELGEEAEETIRDIRELGYSDKLLGNLKVDYNYDKEKQELNIRKVAVGVKDVGEVNLALHLGLANLPEEFEEALEELLLSRDGSWGAVGDEEIGWLLFYGAKITYKDESLAERLMRLKAKEENKSLKAFKESLIQEIEEVETESERRKYEFTKKALVEIKKFIKNPKGFSISVLPSRPQPFSRIMRLMRLNDPEDIAKLLNIQIKSDKQTSGIQILSTKTLIFIMAAILLLFTIALVMRKVSRARASKGRVVVSGYVFCTQCGHQNPSAAIFCTNCGEKL